MVERIFGCWREFLDGGEHFVDGGEIFWMEESILWMAESILWMVESILWMVERFFGWMSAFCGWWRDLLDERGFKILKTIQFFWVKFLMFGQLNISCFLEGLKFKKYLV